MIRIIKKSFSRRENIIYSLIEPVFGYTRIVFAAKTFLIFLAIILIGLLIAIPLINSVNEEYKISFSSLETVEKDENAVMVRPRFQSVDKKGQPFNISSKSATKQSEDLVFLNKPVGDITFADGKKLEVIGNKGTLKIKSKIVLLTDGVIVNHVDGYQIKTDAVSLNLDNNSLKGNTPILMTSEFGILEANSFEGYQDNQRIKFTDGVKMKILTDVIKNKDIKD